MPQINKIRIVNFRYNDGNRFIPDELYDLSSESGEALNTLFNLNNGGGKTVLVQLMMQPIRPRAMAGGRHVEDYFSRPGDHSFVLIEWNKDGSAEKLLTGIAIAGSATISDDNKRGNSIRYYTFLTEYERYSPYSISALELSKNESGRYVPATFEYVRERAKQSKGALIYYSSDESVKWSDKLSEYGIYRSEWETVIETLNRDEGGLNDYFNEAKTSDKLISKFFIPAIEQKMKSVALGKADGSLETMLINYAKKISEKDEVIKEKQVNDRLIQELDNLNEISDNLYTANDELAESIGEVCGFKAAVAKRISSIDADMLNVEEIRRSLNAELKHIDHEEKSKEYYDALSEQEISKDTYTDAENVLNEIRRSTDEKKHEGDLLQCAKLYRDSLETDNKIKALKKLIFERENESDDAGMLAKLKYSVFKKSVDKITETNILISEKETEINLKNEELSNSMDEMKASEKEFEEAKDNYNTSKAHLDVVKESADEKVIALEMNVYRRFDGFYSDDEIEVESLERKKLQENLHKNEKDFYKEIEVLDSRKNNIPEELADIKVALNSKYLEKEGVEKEIREYLDLYDRLVKVCEKYSLDENVIFSGRLLNVVKEDMEITESDIMKCNRDLDTLEDRIKAAKEGYVHLHPTIMEYVISTGINCQTGEEYICGLAETGVITQEKTVEILDKYPELAYSLLFSNEKDLNKLINAGNIDYLPAAVPLFTMEQVNGLLEGTISHTAFLAICDREYFSDRNEYQSRLQTQLTTLKEKISRLESQLKECESSFNLVSKFDYHEDWYEEKQKFLNEIIGDVDNLLSKQKLIEKEYSDIGLKINSLKKELDECLSKLGDINSWFKSYEELVKILAREKELSQKLDDAYNLKLDKERRYKESCAIHEKCKCEITNLKDKLNALYMGFSNIKAIHDKVDGAKETAVLEGDLDGLYTQYMTLSRNLDESLSVLKVSLDEAHEKRVSLEEELKTYDCEKPDYESLHFSTDLFKDVKSQIEKLSIELDKSQSAFNDANALFVSANNRLERAKVGLSAYDGVALVKNEIGDDFSKRIKHTEDEIRVQTAKSEELSKEKRMFERLFDLVGSELDRLQYGEVVKTVILNPDPNVQWREIRSNLLNCENEYKVKKEKLERGIDNIVRDFKEIALSEIVNKLRSIGNMLEDVGIKGDRLFTIGESISAMIFSIEKINRKIETDLKEIENDFNDIVDQCMTQGKRMYTDLRMIAQSSRAHIFPDKPQTQMVKMDLPEEKEISVEASRISIKTEIEHGANEIKALLNDGADEKQILKRARIIVGSERLLHKYIRQESIQVKVYKIDMNSANSVYKKWEDTLTQSSGAEKFVVFFSVVLTLMNYTRSSAGLVSKYNRSVLILDNPFGKITSAHLLKPMFDIARHFNVQLICLSDINKSDVINCFECVIKLVIKLQNLSNFEIMTHEGNERIEHGYYKIMNGQMSLF